MRDLVLPLATAWVRAFNQAELTRPYGVWAIFRPQQKAIDAAPGATAPTGDHAVCGSSRGGPGR